MALKIIDYNTPQYQDMLDLRYQVLRKPLGLEYTAEELKTESEDILIGCFDDDIIEGCCILTKISPNVVKLRQMAVSKNLQSSGVGKVIINFAENIARDNGFSKITMDARQTAEGFYKKLGYEPIGDVFVKIGLTHIVMEKTL